MSGGRRRPFGARASQTTAPRHNQWLHHWEHVRLVDVSHRHRVFQPMNHQPSGARIGSLMALHLNAAQWRCCSLMGTPASGSGRTEFHCQQTGFGDGHLMPHGRARSLRAGASQRGLNGLFRVQKVGKVIELVGHFRRWVRGIGYHVGSNEARSGWAERIRSEFGEHFGLRTPAARSPRDPQSVGFGRPTVALVDARHRARPSIEVFKGAKWGTRNGGGLAFAAHPRLRCSPI